MKLHSVFTDNMVLQRDRDIVVWGTAAPGCMVTVFLHSQRKNALADACGRWQLKMPPMPAGGPYELEINWTGNNRIILRNVMVGDVWLCAGQSNMDMELQNVFDADEEIGLADHPQIRFFKVPRLVSARPHDKVDGQWQTCSPATARSFSAISYFYARELSEALNVPIGVICSARGATMAEAWTPIEALESDPELAPILEKVQTALTAYLDHKGLEGVRRPPLNPRIGVTVANGCYQDPGIAKVAKTWNAPDLNDQSWTDVSISRHWVGAQTGEGAVWFRKTVTIPSDWIGQELTLSLGLIHDGTLAYVNGNPVTAVTQGSPQRDYAVPAGMVKGMSVTLAVRVFGREESSLSGQAKDVWLCPKTGGEDQRVLLAGSWKCKVELELPPLVAPAAPFSLEAANTPTGLFNGMIHPLTHFVIRGVAWYQGESNVGRAQEYRILLRALISGWREKWGLGDFPFLVVQLANYLKPPRWPEESEWAELREAQSLALLLPNAGLVTTIDLGDAGNIHPVNKQDVGRRLALVARRLAYGENIVHSGPTVESMTDEGGRVRLNFRNIGSGLVSKDGQPLRHFAVAGRDGIYHWAEAEIVGSCVRVWSDKVGKPVSVRYAWADNPAGCNLYNREGLPAVPFRMDAPSMPAESGASAAET